jgi:hypothetical protein
MRCACASGRARAQRASVCNEWVPDWDWRRGRGWVGSLSCSACWSRAASRWRRTRAAPTWATRSCMCLAFSVPHFSTRRLSLLQSMPTPRPVRHTPARAPAHALRCLSRRLMRVHGEPNDAGTQPASPLERHLWARALVVAQLVLYQRTPHRPDVALEAAKLLAAVAQSKHCEIAAPARGNHLVGPCFRRPLCSPRPSVAHTLVLLSLSLPLCVCLCLCAVYQRPWCVRQHGTS